MGTFIAALIGKKIFGHVIGEKLARVIAYAGLFLLLGVMLGGIVAWIRSDAVADHQVKLERRAAPATDKASTERANDTIANSKKEEGLHNAIASQPDQPISATSRALACQRLRNAGKRSPACA